MWKVVGDGTDQSGLLGRREEENRFLNSVTYSRTELFGFLIPKCFCDTVKSFNMIQSVYMP